MTLALLAPHAALLAAGTTLSVLCLREGYRGRHTPGHGRERPHSRHAGTKQQDHDALEGDQQMPEITAPWTPEQVTALNHHQDAGAMHPFTCGNLHDDSQSPVLTATADGWRCPNPTCDYRQDWAHAFMAATEEPTR